MMYFLTVFGTFVLPFILLYYYWKKTAYFISFMLEVVCFLVTQMFFRPIFLNGIVIPYYLPDYRMFNSMTIIVVAAFSAGFFEETGRYFIGKTRRKGWKPSFQDAVAFGLGHASLESVGIGLTNLMSWKELYYLDVNFLNLLIPLDRIISGVAHVAFTMIVFYGLRRKRKQRLFLLIAILYHFALDFIGGTFLYVFDFGQAILGGVWAVEHEKYLMWIYTIIKLLSAYMVILFAKKGFVKMEKEESYQLSEGCELSPL